MALDTYPVKAKKRWDSRPRYNGCSDFSEKIEPTPSEKESTPLIPQEGISDKVTSLQLGDDEHEATHLCKESLELEDDDCSWEEVYRKIECLSLKCRGKSL